MHKRLIVFVLTILLVTGSWPRIARAGAEYSLIIGTPGAANITSVYHRVEIGTSACLIGSPSAGYVPGSLGATCSWGATNIDDYVRIVFYFDDGRNSWWPCGIQTTWSSLPASGTRCTVSWTGGRYVNTTGYVQGCLAPGDAITVAGGNATFTYTGDTSHWVSWDQVQGLISVSVALTGPTSVASGSSYDYTALVAHGTPPYSVVFQRIGDLPADDYTWSPQTGSGTTYTQSIMFPSALRSYTVQVTVTDAEQHTATDTLTINPHAERPTVYGYLQEGTTGSGDFLDFVCSLTHNGTYPAESEWLPCEAPGAGRYWYTLDVPAWSVHGAAHYTLRLASPWPNPLTAMITIHDETSGDVWTLVFSFDTSGLTGPGDWIDSEGGGEQFNEEETWIGRLLSALEAMLKRVFQWLFVPSASSFGDQLSSSWIAIASPVPNVTPQYTIPIPNTGHIMADTGETVNIDFSGIQDWSGYSVTRTIVQAILDAILVFVTISIIT